MDPLKDRGVSLFIDVKLHPPIAIAAQRRERTARVLVHVAQGTMRLFGRHFRQMRQPRDIMVMGMYRNRTAWSDMSRRQGNKFDGAGGSLLRQPEKPTQPKNIMVFGHKLHVIHPFAPKLLHLRTGMLAARKANRRRAHGNVTATDFLLPQVATSVEKNVQLTTPSDPRVLIRID